MSKLSPISKVAVGAASGRLGHAVLEALAGERGTQGIVAIARDPQRVRVPGIEKRRGDYGSVPAMQAALAGADTLLMISAPVVGNTDRLALHRNVIEAARRTGVSTVIYTSVIGGPGVEDTLFYPSHLVNRQTEEALRESELGWIIARNGLYMELDLEHIIRAETEGVYTNPGGNGRAPYITIPEIAYACARLASDPAPHRGRVYNIVGQCATQAQLVALANEAFGLHVRYETISDEANIEKFRRLMPERGEAVARMLTGCFQCIREGAFDVPSDYEAAAGRKPKSLREMMDQCRQRRAQQTVQAR